MKDEEGEGSRRLRIADCGLEAGLTAENAENAERGEGLEAGARRKSRFPAVTG